jgi:hypothetical protein
LPRDFKNDRGITFPDIRFASVDLPDKVLAAQALSLAVNAVFQVNLHLLDLDIHHSYLLRLFQVTIS